MTLEADIRYGSVQRYRSRWHLQGVAGDAADDEADSAAANGKLDRLPCPHFFAPPAFTRGGTAAWREGVRAGSIQALSCAQVTNADKWTLKLGLEYLCVAHLPAPQQGFKFCIYL